MMAVAETENSIPANGATITSSLTTTTCCELHEPNQMLHRLAKRRDGPARLWDEGLSLQLEVIKQRLVVLNRIFWKDLGMVDGAS